MEAGWRAYLYTDPDAAAGRTAIEQAFKAVKEVEGAGQQQLRYWRPNEGALVLQRYARRK